MHSRDGPTNVADLVPVVSSERAKSWKLIFPCVIRALPIGQDLEHERLMREMIVLWTHNLLEACTDAPQHLVMPEDAPIERLDSDCPYSSPHPNADDGALSGRWVIESLRMSAGAGVQLVEVFASWHYYTCSPLREDFRRMNGHAFLFLGQRHAEYLNDHWG